jgi:hypothetical protein
MNLAKMHMSGKKVNAALLLKVGELVEVRSKQEILATLDGDACLDGLPFMPQMFQYCGMRFRVYKRAHKTCDTVFPTRSRRMANAVHLETRCDGEAHGGCQAGCLIFWKDAWLRRVNADADGSVSSTPDQDPQLEQSRNHNECTEDGVWRGTQAANQDGEEPTYVCQATRLPYATTDLQWWDIRQYLEDYRSGNVASLTILKGLIYSGLFYLSRLRGVGWRMSRLYDKIHPLWGGTPWPKRRGYIPMGKPTPTQTLNLQPGELVRVKPHREILRTLNSKCQNRGMVFDKEMVPYCGGEYRVHKRVSRIINEKTGKMQVMKIPCIVLNSVVCQSRYSDCRLFCPRSIYSFWREIWLERPAESGINVGEPTGYQAAKPNQRAVPNGAWRAASGTSQEQQKSSEKQWI